MKTNRGGKKFFIQTTLLLVITVLAMLNRNAIRQQVMVYAVGYDDANMCRICILLGEDVNANIYVNTDEGMGDDHYLNYAVNIGSPKAMEVLIRKGALLDRLDYRGRTPLGSAVKNGDFQAVKLLLDSGASATLKDIYGQTPLYIAKSVMDDSIIREIKDHLP